MYMNAMPYRLMLAKRNVLPNKAQRLVVLAEWGLDRCLGSFVLFAKRSITSDEYSGPAGVFAQKPTVTST
jgi:hypothetical protein